MRLKRRVKQHIKQNQRENQKRSEDTYKEITQMQHKQENLRGTEKNNEKLLFIYIYIKPLFQTERTQRLE